MFPIESVLRHYGAEKIPMGPGNRKMRCPFHQPDNNPSASVHHDKGVFFCFTCGMGGDAISLIIRREQCGYKKAVSIAEEITGTSGDGVREARQSGTDLFGKARNNLPGRSGLSTRSSTR